MPPASGGRECVANRAEHEKSVAPLRSFLAEPLELAHCCWQAMLPTSYHQPEHKGLNLALGDVALMSRGLIERYRGGCSAALDDYSSRALRRIWQAERFSWWMTSQLHVLPELGAFGRRI